MQNSIPAKVAILIPCYNEELTITSVIQDFRTHLPDASIYVFDNNSSDETTTRARKAVHAVELRMAVAELMTACKSRPEGSASKLNTYRDGLRILLMILRLFKAEKPLPFFSIGFVICALVSIILAVPVFETYVETGL